MAQLVDDNRKKKEESGDQSAVSEHFPTKTRLVRNRIPLDECQAIYLMPRFAADASIACEILEITFLARIRVGPEQCYCRVRMKTVVPGPEIRLREIR